MRAAAPVWLARSLVAKHAPPRRFARPATPPISSSTEPYVHARPAPTFLEPPVSHALKLAAPTALQPAPARPATPPTSLCSADLPVSVRLDTTCQAVLASPVQRFLAARPARAAQSALSAILLST